MCVFCVFSFVYKIQSISPTKKCIKHGKHVKNVPKVCSHTTKCTEKCSIISVNLFLGTIILWRKAFWIWWTLMLIWKKKIALLLKHLTKCRYLQWSAVEKSIVRETFLPIIPAVSLRACAAERRSGALAFAVRRYGARTCALAHTQRDPLGGL